MPQYKVFALVLATTFSVFAYPSIQRMSDNLLAELNYKVVDVRTTTEIYQEYFGPVDSADTPIISDRLVRSLKNGAWYNNSATDQGNRRLEILNQARKINQKKAVKLYDKSTPSNASSRTSSQAQRNRNQTISKRTRSSTLLTATSRIKQFVRNRRNISAQLKRRRDLSRGRQANSQRRSILDRTRRFQHTRSGTFPKS